MPPRLKRGRPRRQERVLSTSASPVPPPEPSVVPPPPPPPVGVPPPPAPPVEAFQAFMSFWNVYTAQAQAGNVPQVAPPITLAPPASPQSTDSLPKRIKEARQMGCETFAGTLDVTVAKNWIKHVSEMMIDMDIDDEMKLKVVTRFLEGQGKKAQEDLSKKRGSNFGSRQSSKKSNTVGTSGGTSLPGSMKPLQKQQSPFRSGGSTSNVSSTKKASGADKCRASLATPSPHDRIVNKKGNQSVVQPKASNVTRSGTGSNLPNQSFQRPQTRSQTRVFALSNEEAQIRPNVVTGTMSIFQHDAYVLIDSGAEMSFINTKFAQYSDKNLSPLEPEIVVNKPLHEEIVKNTVYKGCSVMIGGKEFMADLIPLEFRDFDVILGMDWLSFHRANVDCFTKEVTFRKPGEPEVIFVGERRILPSCVISTIKAVKLIQKGYPAYLAHGTMKTRAKGIMEKSTERKKKGAEVYGVSVYVCVVSGEKREGIMQMTWLTTPPDKSKLAPVLKGEESSRFTTS
ncbi:Retroviral aspartyl protease [Corchorus olitorius]|uniref:Retroviral aspartyl protease n=1 Tax=Corchorus olitorius TaxID=93759 RepID=A0A1R3G534_9ROSI|nr:Retroviral aspartyl protease [Corchorus olitorius]